jgi:hypothetical protein
VPGECDFGGGGGGGEAGAGEETEAQATDHKLSQRGGIKIRMYRILTDFLSEGDAVKVVVEYKVMMQDCEEMHDRCRGEEEMGEKGEEEKERNSKKRSNDGKILFLLLPGNLRQVDVNTSLPSIESVNSLSVADSRLAVSVTVTGEKTD